MRSGELTTIEQNFTWGVLALNTHKSIYHEGEDVLISIAVLDDTGRMVCDAEITLEITDPENKKTVLTTKNKDIIVTESCYIYNITSRPDFYTTYKTKKQGIYTLNLTAKTPNGKRTLVDSFEVSSSVEFDVKGPLQQGYSLLGLRM